MIFTTHSLSVKSVVSIFYPGLYPYVSNLHPLHPFANNVDESGRMIANKQSCPHRNFRRNFPAFEIKSQRTLSVRPGGGRIHYPRRENGKGCNAVFYHEFYGLKGPDPSNLWLTQLVNTMIFTTHSLSVKSVVSIFLSRFIVFASSGVFVDLSFSHSCQGMLGHRPRCGDPVRQTDG